MNCLEAWERDRPYAVAVDTETEGLEFFARPFLASFWWDEQGYAVDLGSEEGQEATRTICAETPALLFHNAKFDLQKLELVGLYDRNARQLALRSAPSCVSGSVPRGVHDTEALAHLLDEHRPKGLKPLARSVLGLETDEADVIRKTRRQMKLTKADGLDKLPREVVIPYAIKDVEFTWKLFWTLWPLLRRHEDLRSLYEIERELMWVLLDMEWAGMAVDLDYVHTASKEYAGKSLKAEWAIEDATGLKVWYPDKPGRKTPEGSFNPNSKDQIHAYFSQKGVALESTDKAHLKETEDPLAPALLELRSSKKMGDYLSAILREEREGVLHPNFRQHGTRGRRMSSGEAEG